MSASKYKNGKNNSNGNKDDLLSIKNVIQEIAQAEIQKYGLPTYKAAIVQKINEDGTVDVYLPPNQENLVTGILNKCGELLFVGDSVELATKNGSLTNCWVAIKHGTIVQGQAEEVENLSGEVVMKVKNGRLSVTELQRDPSLVSAFTIIAEDINLDGMNIVLNGSRGITISSPYFNVTSQGYITATGGKIGGWEMGDTRLYSGSGSNYVALDSGTQGTNYPIWAGNENPANAPFSVTRGGTIKATNGTIGSFTLNTNRLYSGTGTNTAGIGVYGSDHAFWAGSETSSSAPFRVGHGGGLVATNATITGSVTATSGKIADYTINGAMLVGNNVGLSGTSGQGWAFWAGSNDAGSAPFRVGHNGSMYATSGSFTGSINTGSTITGSTISGGSISITKGSCYFTMGTSTNHPSCSGLNVSSAVLIGGTELSKSDGRLRCYGDFQAANFYTLGHVQCNDYIAGSAINLLSGSSSGSASGGGILLKTGNGHITLNAANGGGNVYASGTGVSNAKVVTDNGSASSKNTKTNIEKFASSDYKKALNLLSNIDIYSYDYKYDLYQNRHQYGFIIDEIEKIEGYEKYFDFHSEKAGVFGDHLDFSMGEKDSNPDDVIEVKEYNRDTLDKFMLTCMKAMQDKIDKQEEEIKELKEIIKNIIV